MSTLADLVADQAEAVLAHWTDRLRRELAPGRVSEPELRDHAPLLLAELVAALRAGILPTRSAAAIAHGRQRAEIGFDIESVEREYAILRSILLDAVEAAGLALTTSEVRTLTELFGIAVAESVAAHARHERDVHARQAEQTRSLLAQREAHLAAEQHARAEAQAERAKQHALFMQAPVAIAILEGPRHVFTFANPAYRALVNGRDVVGQALLEALPDVRDQGFDVLLDQVMATGEAFVGKEVRVQLAHHAAGEPLILNFVYTPKRAASGEVDGVLMSGWDVTEQVVRRERFESLATELRTSQARLRGAVEVLEQSRVVEHQLRREAEEANRAKDEFLAMLGHEMRNPLAPITTALQLMRLRSEAEFTKERTIIERQVDHLTRLVDDLLDVSRITRGKVELERRPLDLAAVVAEAIEVASPLLEQRRHELQIAVPASGLTVDGDPVRLVQVMSNLLTNAAKYTEPGGRIAISAAREGDEVVVRVRDNGVGIAPEMLPRVFELFAQGQQAIDRARGGLGLGLAIVRTLVGLHGGSVEVHSAGLGHGSEFAVRLPVAAPRVSAPPAASAELPRIVLEPHRILIVDDNVDAAEMLAATLELVGHEIRIAHDGPSALQVVADFVPDLAVLDIGLPVMDGYELGRRLREVPRLAQLRLVALTGYGQRSDRDRSAEAGFEAHLVKPVQMALLETIITGGA